MSYFIVDNLYQEAKSCLDCEERFIASARSTVRCVVCQRERNLERNRGRLTQCVCRFCGDTFKARGAKTNYCSETCRFDGLGSANCATCGASFKQTSVRHRFCQLACRDTGQGKYRLRFMVLDRDNYTCQYCGRTPAKHQAVLHVDHRVPRSKGGPDTLENLITSCDRCNLGKGDWFNQ